MTILKSWSQGVGVWSLEGKRKLWSASSVKIYGGVSEGSHRDELSPPHRPIQPHHVSRSHSKAGSSSSRPEGKDEILTVADLTALPALPGFRTILLISRAPATMIETNPWMNEQVIARRWPGF